MEGTDSEWELNSTERMETGLLLDGVLVGLGPLEGSAALDVAGAKLRSIPTLRSWCSVGQWNHFLLCYGEQCPYHTAEKQSLGYYPQRKWNWQPGLSNLVSFLAWREQEGDSWSVETDGRKSWTVLHEEHQMKEDERVLWEDTVVYCCKADKYISVECWQRVVDERGVEVSQRRDSRWDLIIERKYEDGMSLAEKEFVVAGHVCRLYSDESRGCGALAYDARADTDVIIRPRDDKWVGWKPDDADAGVIYV